MVKEGVGSQNVLFYFTFSPRQVTFEKYKGLLEQMLVYHTSYWGEDIE